MKPPVQKTEDHRSREAPQNPSVDADPLAAFQMAAERLSCEGQSSSLALEGQVLRRKMRDIASDLFTAIARAESSQGPTSVRSDRVAELEAALGAILDGMLASRQDIDVDDWIEIAGAALPTPASSESSQGVDASLVAQQNQELSSDSGSPTSRRGSHITELLDALRPIMPANAEVAAEFDGGKPDDIIPVRIPVRCFRTAMDAWERATGSRFITPNGDE